MTAVARPTYPVDRDTAVPFAPTSHRRRYLGPWAPIGTTAAKK
jgi:hypothetical protein